MAQRTIARPSAPASPSSASTGTGTPPPPGGPSAADRLENTLAQLSSLLWACHGDGTRWDDKQGGEHLDNVLWLAWDLSRQAQVLFQECAPQLNAQP